MALAPPTLAVHDARSLAAAQTTFNMVAFHWLGSSPVHYRVRFRDGWSPWRAADADAVEHGWHLGNLDWVGAATGLQTRPAVGVRAYTVWSPVDSTPPQRRLQIANAPPIIPRLSWGADESIRRAKPEYAPALRFAVIHHTAGTNTYTRAQSAAIVRGIELYHVQGNGWNDIGYNFLVDKYGQVFEGRYGGVDRPVIGAHAEGFNTGSVGVSVIGDYTSRTISAAAATSLEQLLAWRLDLAHIDPLSLLTVASQGNSRYARGTPALLRAIGAHRDVYFSDCPGNALYAQIPTIAKAIAALGGPKIYAPLVQRVDETHVRFAARVSAAIPWTVTVTGSSGSQVAQGTGSGGTIDWTWDASAAPADRYTWSIAAGSARPASGSFGAAQAFSLQHVSTSPSTVAPGDTVTIAYTLGAAATVIATLVNAAGAPVVTLLTAPKPAGPQTLAFTPNGLANGMYSVALSAVSGTSTASAAAPLTIDDVVRGFSVVPGAASFTLARVPTTVSLQVLSGATLVASPYVAPLSGPQTIPLPPLADGDYTITLATDTGLRSLPLTIDTTAPTVKVISFRNTRFSVSEAATLTLVVGTKRYTRVVPKAATTQFWLKAKPTAYVLRVTDASGHTTTIHYRA